MPIIINVMGIHEIEATEVNSWSRLAAEHMAELRTASGALSQAAAGDFMHRVLSKFKVGTPIHSRIFVNDDVSNWLWLETNPELRVVDAKIDDIHEVEWLEVFNNITQGEEVAYECFSGATPFLLSFPQRECGIEMLADIDSVRREYVRGSRVTLRPMYSGEVMQFMVTAANQRGNALALINPDATKNALKRDAFRDIERKLSDGIFTPGHALYAVCAGDQVVGNVWFELDAGVAHIHAVVLDAAHKTDALCKAVIVAVADIVKDEGMRRVLIELTPFERDMIDVLMEIGFLPVRRHARIVGGAAQRLISDQHVFA